jgi:hypothetical protein
MMRIHADAWAWVTGSGTTRAICVDLRHRLSYLRCNSYFAVRRAAVLAEPRMTEKSD